MGQLTPPDKPRVVVIGAGAAGFSAAIELADKGYYVELIEKNTLGSGASGSNPGRMGHGFHYADKETALAYLHASMKVQKKYPGYLVGQDLPFDSPYRHGRYFIVKNSDHPPETILETYAAINDEYARLVKEDPTNAVFGPPETFLRTLKQEEYASYVNADIVDAAVETCEHLFNWEAFAKDIREKVANHPNINLREHTEVKTISRNKPNFNPSENSEIQDHEDTLTSEIDSHAKQTHEEALTLETDSNSENKIKPTRFTLQLVDKDGNTVDIHTDYLINSTWQNIKLLNDQIGLRMIPGERTNRLKALLEVELPESLIKTNSMFFCMGQHGMMSNMGDGRAMFTFAKVTNLEASSDLKLSEHAERLLRGEITEEEKDSITQQMLEGISHYIPDMKHAKVLNLKFGIVQTKGKLTLDDLNDKNNVFHKRSDHCVTSEQTGVISNPCMKLFYFADNGELVAELMEQHVQASEKIGQCMALIQQKMTQAQLPPDPILLRNIQEQLERYEVLDLLDKEPEKLVAPYLATLLFKTKMNFFVNSSVEKTEPYQEKAPPVWRTP